MCCVVFASLHVLLIMHFVYMFLSVYVFLSVNPACMYTVCDTDNLTFSLGIRDCLLLAYEDNPKEHHGYSLRIHASYRVSMHGFVRKMAVSRS